MGGGPHLKASQSAGDPALLGLMARRIGDLEAEKGLKWLVAEAAQTPDNPAFEPLFPDALGGTELSWKMQQPVKKSAAATWFSSQPDEALAWHLEESNLDLSAAEREILQELSLP